jgi:hypothetical protein
MGVLIWIAELSVFSSSRSLMEKFVYGKSLDFGIGWPVAGLFVEGAVRCWACRPSALRAGNQRFLGGCVGDVIRIRYIVFNCIQLYSTVFIIKVLKRSEGQKVCGQLWDSKFKLNTVEYS